MVGGNRRLEKVRYGELSNLYFSGNMIMVIESGSMKWVDKAAHLDEKKNACTILAGKSEEKREFGRPVYIDGNMMLRCFLSGWVVVDSVLLAQEKET